MIAAEGLSKMCTNMSKGAIASGDKTMFFAPAPGKGPDWTDTLARSHVARAGQISQKVKLDPSDMPHLVMALN